MTAESIPVIGHVGLIPHFCTWTGGYPADYCNVSAPAVEMAEFKRLMTGK
jgi:ketopantoate hydroxymethyltransferase